MSAVALWPASVEAARACSPPTACTISGASDAPGEPQPAGRDPVAFVRIGANTNQARGDNSRGPPVQFNGLTGLQPAPGSEYADLFSQFGTDFRSSGGGKERIAVVPELPVAWLLVLGLLAVVLRRAPLSAGSNSLWRMRGDALADAAAWGEIDRRAVMAPTLRLSGESRGNEARHGRAIDAAQPS